MFSIKFNKAILLIKTIRQVKL